MYLDLGSVVDACVRSAVRWGISAKGLVYKTTVLWVLIEFCRRVNRRKANRLGVKLTRYSCTSSLVAVWKKIISFFFH